MKWQELDIKKLINIVPGSNDYEKRANAFDIKYGDYDYANDLRILSNLELQAYFDNVLQDRRTPIKEILILGANSGSEIQYLSGANITAIDLSRRALRKLSDKYAYIKTEVMDMNELSFEDNSFDIVICMRSIQSYGVSIEKVIGHMYRITKRGGINIISVPNGYILDGRVIKGMFDPSRDTYNEELPIKLTREIDFEYLKYKLSTIKTNTESEIIVHSLIEK